MCNFRKRSGSCLAILYRADDSARRWTDVGRCEYRQDCQAGGRDAIRRNNRGRIRRAVLVVPIGDPRGLDLPPRLAVGDQLFPPCAGLGALLCLAASSVWPALGCAWSASPSLVVRWCPPWRAITPSLKEAGAPSRCPCLFQWVLSVSYSVAPRRFVRPGSP